MASAQKASKRTTNIEIQKHGSGSIPQQSRRRVAVRTLWPTTCRSSCPLQYKIGSRDFQRTPSVPGEISVPSSSTTSGELLRNLELNGIFIRSNKRKANPFGNTSGGS